MISNEKMVFKYFYVKSRENLTDQIEEDLEKLNEKYNLGELSCRLEVEIFEKKGAAL